MLAAKIPLKEAEKAKKEIIKKDLMDDKHRIIKKENHLLIPLKEGETIKEKIKEIGYEIVEENLPERTTKITSLKEALKKKLPKEILNKIKTAYDQVGDIAILEIDPELSEYDKIIGETLLKINPKIKTALAKDGSHEGVFRTQKMRLLAGEDKRETTHKENNTTIKVDVEKVYFSARLSTERKRIIEQIKPGEEVLVMFSGCGPYTMTIAKNTQAKEVKGIEINPKGHELAEENKKKNKLKNVINIQGDVKKIAPELAKKGKKYDRILMPLPKNAENFLKEALMLAKKGTIIHFYSFLHEKEFNKAEEWIKEACEKEGKEYEIITQVKCGQQAPYVFRICTDFKIKN